MVTSRISETGLTIRGLSKTYHNSSSTVLSDISISIAPNEIFALIGRSGSGKSTLLRIIAGLEAASEGAVICDSSESKPARMVYLFQDYSRSLLPWRTVLANVALALEAQDGFTHKSAMLAAQPYLADVGLADVAEKYPWQLSGGMQQRVAIARALAAQPDVLLLDEPFGALDSLTRLSLQDLLLTVWAERGLTLVLVTHDVDEAIYLADRIAVLSSHPGKITDIYDTGLPRPRHNITTREDPRFVRARHTILENVLGPDHVS